MTDADWKELEDLLGRALALNENERENFVESVTSRDPTLGSRLRDLLADDSDDEHLKRPIAAIAGSLGDTQPDPWEGRCIGAWTIRRRLADGGMGAVFLAERSDDEYEQTVAVKVMTSQLVHRDALARFRAERQILASLSHPHIARLIDAGSTTDNLPYIVMEYVDGEPIDTWCDRNRLDVPTRLALLGKVCGAVDYAHRNLVVHRDLKPSNILIDGDGEPRLLDFGIAKLLENGDRGHTMAMTRAGYRIMTPEYASPEQVRGEPVTVATDVYALGVLLYRLLTGHSPYGDRSESAHGIEQAIIESDPRRPSTVVDTPATGVRDTSPISPEDAGISRSSSPARLRKLLAGDLDNIVLKCLQKDPERRYASARHLGEDIANYLADRPVLARPESFLYSAGKFLRRNRWPAATAAIFVVTIAGLLAFSAARLAEQRDAAQLQAGRAEEVAGFLTDLFAEANPATHLGEPLTARQMLDRGAERIARELAGQPALQAALMVTIGDSYIKMRENRTAREYLEEALRVAEASVGREHEDVLQLRQLFANSLTQTGDAALAKPLHETNHEVWSRLYGPRSAEAGRELGHLALVDATLGNLEAAEAQYREAVGIFRALGAAGESELAAVLTDYGGLLRKLDRADEEETFLLEALAITERQVGTSHPDYAGVLNNLGNHYLRRGRLAEAAPFYVEHLRLQRELVGETGIAYGNALFNYAGLVRARGDKHESLRLMDEALEIYGVGYGETSIPYAYALENRANALKDLDRDAESEEAFLRALQIIGAKFGTDHPEYAFTQANYGGLLIEADRDADAEKVMRPAVATYLAAHGPDHSRTVSARVKLAQSLWPQGKLDEALTLASDALASARKLYPEPHISLATAMRALATVHRERKEYEASDRLYREAIAVSEAMEEKSVRWAAAAERELAESLARRRLFDEAAGVLQARLASLGDDEAEVRQKMADKLAEVETARGSVP